MPTIELPDGSEVSEGMIAELETKLQSQSPEEFQGTRFEKRREKDPATPFTARSSFVTRQVAGARHRERSAEARTADESFNAPIAPSYAAWRANPNRYDLPGVDTIPQERQQQRAEAILERAQRAGAVAEVEETSDLDKSSWKGSFSSAHRRVKIRPDEELEDEFPMFRSPAVLAHEVGHAADRKVFTDLLDRNDDQIDDETRELYEEHADGMDTRYFSQLSLEADHQLRQEVRTLSERKRGTIDGKNAIGDTWDAYRMNREELLADAFASFVLEPRAARREAPRAVEHLEETVMPALERDRSGRPLDAAPGAGI